MKPNKQVVEPEVVFTPLKGSQEYALDTRADITLYHGTRGPGKSITQLMRFRSRVGQGYGSFWRGIIFDREFKNLGDIIEQSKRFFPKFDDGCKFLSSHSELKWVWPTGEELLFRHAKRLSDYDGFHGWEIPYLAWNELTKQPTSEMFDKFMSINRSSYTPEKDGWIGGVRPKEGGAPRGPNGEIPKPIPLEVFATTNPSGPGHNWVKKQFITPAPRGEVLRRSVTVFNPKTQKDEVVTKSQVAIFGSYRENIYLDPKYVAELDAIKDPNLRAAWLNGNWDVTAGGALDDLWNTKVHILPRFVIPDNWHVDRAYDHGSTQPFSVGWFAEANGEEVDIGNGYKFCPPRGTLIQIAEWYGTDDIGTNKGLKMSSTKIAEGVIEREISLMEHGWIASQPWPGPADNGIGNKVDGIDEESSDSPLEKMAELGVLWLKSDKSKGSRKTGLQLIRDRLEASLTGEGPGLYFMSNCVGSIETIPSLPRDEDDMDDVDTAAEDHPYDMVRYRCLKSNIRAPKNIKVGFAH